MSQNQSFTAWAGQQPAPAGFNPAGAPAAPAPQWGPPATPPGFVPQQPAPMQAPPAPAPAQAWGSPVPGAAAVPPPNQNLPSGGSVFGAGAFAGAAPMSEQKDCQDGDYIFKIVKTEQFRTREGQPMLRILTTVAHVIAGTQPLNSEVTDSIFYGQAGSDAFRYGMADTLSLAQHALGCRSDHELKAKLQAAAPAATDGPGQAPGTGAWATFADAMQDANQPLSQHFPPNPLAGMFYRAQVAHVPSKKKPGKFNTNFSRMLAQ